MTTVLCASLFLHPKKGHTLNKSDFRNVVELMLTVFIHRSLLPLSHYSKLNNKIHKNVGWQPRNLFIISIWWNRWESVPSFTGLGCRFSGVDINFSSCQPRRQQEVVSSVSVSLHIMCRWCRHKTEEKRKYNKHFPWPLQDDSRFSSYAFCCASDLYRHTT